MSTSLNLSGFSLTYDDEFNSFKSSPDGSIGYRTTFNDFSRSLYSNGELEYYMDSSVGLNPFSLSDGALHITAAPGYTPSGQPYTSGLITTEGSFSQTYGYFEARIEVAQGAGMWSAFWMLPTNNSWPPELDALEAFGAPNSSGDGGATQAAHAVQAPNRAESNGSWAPVDGNIYTSYHTYGIDWEPDFITWYIDGQEVYQEGNIPTPPGIDQPMYMLLNLAVGGWPGNPAGETSVMSVDYLRAYSENPNATPLALQQISSPDGANTTPYGAMDVMGVVGAPDGIVIRVSEDALNGNAQFYVTVDGVRLGGVQTVTASHAAGQWQEITLTDNLGAGPHVIGIDYVNSATGSGNNLYIKSVTIDGELIPGTQAQNNAANGHQALDTSAAVMTVVGAAQFTSTGTTGSYGVIGAPDGIVVRVSEDALNGNAQFYVTVDGLRLGGIQTVTASHGLGQWQDITLTGNLSAGSHVIGIDYINNSAGIGSNLYVQSVSVDGDLISGTHAQNNAANGEQSLDPTAAVMTIAGVAAFTSTGTTNAHGVIGGSDNIVVRVSEDALNGNAQFYVTVDGLRLGGIQTVTASHAAGLWQTVTLTDHLSAGPHAIGIDYISPATGNGSNLYVQSITVDGELIPGNQAQNNAANGEQSLDPTAAVLTAAGAAQFTTTGVNPSLLSTLTLHVAEDAFAGDAQFLVFVDGTQLGGIQTVTAAHSAGHWQDIMFTGNFGNLASHTVVVSFINDDWGGSAATDRNMYVQSITLNGEVVQGTTAVDNATGGHASSDPTAAVMAINGTASFVVAPQSTVVVDSGTGPSSVTLTVSEDAWSGDAQFTVSVDGVQLGGIQTVTASHAAGHWQNITVNGNFSSLAPNEVVVTFLNDGWGGSTATDRNMYVQSINVNGEIIQGPTAQDTATGGHAAADLTAAVMDVNGTATFQSHGTGTPQPSTLVLHVSEDAWNGNAQFTVSVDGVQVGGIQTATASHALGQTQAITLTGNFGMLGPNTVDISFLNDGWGGSAATDRNLYVQSIDVNGVHFAGNAAADNAAGGQAALDLNAAVLAINGTVEFNIHHQAPPDYLV